MELSVPFFLVFQVTNPTHLVASLLTLEGSPILVLTQICQECVDILYILYSLFSGYDHLILPILVEG